MKYLFLCFLLLETFSLASEPIHKCVLKKQSEEDRSISTVLYFGSIDEMKNDLAHRKNKKDYTCDIMNIDDGKTNYISNKHEQKTIDLTPKDDILSASNGASSISGVPESKISNSDIQKIIEKHQADMKNKQNKN